MSGVSQSDGGSNPSAFNPQVIAAVIAAGIFAFIAFWMLSAFAPQLGSGRDGGAHALSRSATSYSVIAELLKASGSEVSIERDDEVDDGLIVLTPPATMTSAAIAEAIDAQDGNLVLIVLPRWTTMPMNDRPGWVHQAGPAETRALLNGDPLNLNATTTMERGGRINGWLLPDQVQVVRGPGLVPVIAAANGGAVLAQVSGRQGVFVLADADLINNRGVSTAERAVNAVALMRFMANGQPIRFDVGLNGFGASRSLLRLAFTPPFLGLTICLLMAGLFALWSGFVRFGPPWRDVRAVAFGKAGLVANSARLIVQAQRVPHFARTYANQVREAAARQLHAPRGLAGAQLDAWLDRFPDSRKAHFSRLAGDLAAASTTSEAVARARALGQWRKDILRDSQ